MKKLFFTLLYALLMISNHLMANTRYYRLAYRDDPSTTVVIGWSNDGTSTNAMVYYGTMDQGTNWSAYPLNHGIDRSSSYVSLTNNFAELTGLTPDTKYYFVVKDDQGVSARYSFKTISDDSNDPVTFIAGGDSRTNVPLIESCTGGNCRLQRQNGNKLVAKIRPDFVAFSGDFILSNYLGLGNIYYADWLEDWQLSFGPDADGGFIAPFMATFGNHEFNDDIYELFDIPNSDNYYAFSFGGNLFRFYTLKVVEGVNVCTDTTQLNWFTHDLQNYTGTSSEPYWKILQYHVPMVPHAETSPNQDMIDCWANLFQPYKVNLCFEGHSHVLKYTWPLVPSSASGSDNGFIRDDANGTVYVGEGCWGAPLRTLYIYYSADAAYNWTRDQAETDGFHLVCVSKQKIEIRTIKFDVVTAVGQVGTYDPPCTLPSNISIWTPSNGAVVEILNNSVGIEDQHLMNNKVEVSPNPAKDIITLIVKQKIPDATIELYNGMGRLIKTEKTDLEDSYPLNLKDLPQGAYFIFIKANGYSELHKIIVD